ncbi:hypothetical protein LTR96_001056 [Exophiala xenobiotica]|nr:hypothetical protein LTR92_003295 [Exophiala xenobiotica]KAK5274455.1 hypothetical protein LTR96_001056 [Exophiala xenobiotica]KAK5343783.1 hypothetical protein LTR98_001413 [Exophiala xenobiotica]
MASPESHFGSSPDYISKHRAQNPSSRTILVTGATAGIGLAIANHLLSSSSQHLLILTGRKTDVLEDLEAKNPDRVISRAGDMSDLDGYVKLVLQGLHLDGRLDGLILNHGTFGSCLRIKDTKVEEDWESTFRINVSSCVALARIVFTSSGAASHAYSSWGAYGASKAAINHLAMTLKAEEPEITTVSVRPGVVDTAMQVDIREKFLKNLDEKDQKKFGSAKDDGILLPPENPGRVIAELAIRAEKDLSGQFLR